MILCEMEIIIISEVLIVKKALSYMIIGALAYGVVDMYVNKKSTIDKHFKKIKKDGMEAINKVKAIF